MDHHVLLDLVAEVGYRLARAGAEIYRVEESIARFLGAYGVNTGEVFAIPSCLIISLTTPDGHSLTRVRRIPAHGTDVYTLEALNGLCRKVCVQTLDEADIRRELDAITHGPQYPLPMLMLAYFIGAGFFTLFWGGTWRDGLCGGVCGLAIGLCLTLLGRVGANFFLQTIAGGAVSALLALGFTTLRLGQNIDVITIGALMVLVPGVQATNAIRDVMAGDMISGLTKLGEALLVGTAIALGTGLALSLTQWFGGGL